MQSFPKMNSDHYYAFLFQDIPDPLPYPGGTVGFILNDDEKEFKIRIVVDDAIVREAKSTTIVLDIYDENMLNGCSIFITRELFRLLHKEEKKYLWAMIWHEVGHYHDYEFLQDKYGENYDRTDIFENRRLNQEKGTIQEEELRADAFAARHFGKSNFINGMDWVIRHRKNHNDNNMIDAVQEMEKRKRAVMRMKN